MRLEQLHYFMTVCDKRSINLASKELFITQQSLSSSINNLEKEVGQNCWFVPTVASIPRNLASASTLSHAGP